MLPHAYATGGAFPDVIQLLLDTHMDLALTMDGKCSVALPGFAQIHVASIQPMHFLDSGGRLEVRGTSASRGKGSCGTRVQVF